MKRVRRSAYADTLLEYTHVHSQPKLAARTRGPSTSCFRPESKDRSYTGPGRNMPHSRGSPPEHEHAVEEVYGREPCNHRGGQARGRP